MDREKLKSILIKANSLEKGKELGLAREFIALDEKIANTAKEVDSKLEEIKEELKKKLESELVLEIDREELKGEKGEDGKDGEDGEKGEQGVAGKDGKDGRDGLVGKDGLDGKDGKDGNDGSPDTAEEIRNKLETLKDEDRLDAKAIKNLPESIVKYAGRGGGVREVIAGTNITVDNSNLGYPVISSTGGSGGTVDAYAEVPTGTVNSVNTVFTLAQAPANTDGVIVLLNGITQYNGTDYNVSGATITFVEAPTTGSTIFAYYNTLVSGGSEETFESTSKNIKAYPYVLNYTGDNLTSIVYTLPVSGTITKTFGYTGDKLTTITLSGDTPSGIDLVKTLAYTGDNLTSITYS